jgi:hypothetical protein
MKKKSFNIWLLAVLLCGLSLSVTSCKDDDKNSEQNESEQEQQAEEQEKKENTAFNVLDNLANLSNAPADYLTGTYEPTIGITDDADAGTRIINTNDMATAVLRFSDLIDENIDENTQTYTWSDDRVGTLTYTKSTDGKSWATVDVSIKQMPHLQKIVYRSPEQSGDNDKFVGTAYYRFGDVILKKNEDGNNEYWICVRPAFGPEGKETSHWVTVSPLPDKNIWTYTGSNGIDYALPTGIGKSKEHAQNFAEMLFAICFPGEWQQNIIDNPYTSIFNRGVPMFNDFDKTRLKYHNQYFWQRVQDAWWARRPLFNELFGSTLQDFKSMLKSDDGLNLLTNGKTWNTNPVFGTNSPTLYRYCFKNGVNKQSNMHLLVGNDYQSVKAEVIRSKIKLNVKKDYTSSRPFLTNTDFFGKAANHYIIRFATGADLSSTGKENPYLNIAGTTDVYRYNDRYGITDLNQDPEVLDRPTGRVVNETYNQKWKHYRGEPHYRFGDIYQDENGHKWMVLLLAGSHKAYNNDINLGDSACFTELISLDGLTPSADKRQITNLPTRDQVMRAAPLLMSYHQYTLNKKLKVEPWNEQKATELGKTVQAQVETCNFDARMLYQIVRAQEEFYWKRQPSWLTSIAYRDPTDTSGKQRLLRVVCNSQNNKSDQLYYFWEHYVKKPDATTQLYAENLYDKTAPIYLQDIASADMIGRYGEDSYARQPLFGWDGWVDGENGTDRQPRTVKDVDKKANDVTNYYYDMAKWKTRDFPRDMWNEPVLMFRMTAVYDRGDTEYATRTVDGHTLTPLKVRDNWIAPGDVDFWDVLYNTYTSVWITTMSKDFKTLWLDGKSIEWPDPFKTWQQSYK